jgi:hypothetical protein
MTTANRADVSDAAPGPRLDGCRVQADRAVPGRCADPDEAVADAVAQQGEKPQEPAYS